MFPYFMRNFFLSVDSFPSGLTESSVLLKETHGLAQELEDLLELPELLELLELEPDILLASSWPTTSARRKRGNHNLILRRCFSDN